MMKKILSLLMATLVLAGCAPASPPESAPLIQPAASQQVSEEDYLDWLVGVNQEIEDALVWLTDGLDKYEKGEIGKLELAVKARTAKEKFDVIKLELEKKEPPPPPKYQRIHSLYISYCGRLSSASYFTARGVEKILPHSRLASLSLAIFEVHGVSITQAEIEREWAKLME